MCRSCTKFLISYFLKVSFLFVCIFLISCSLFNLLGIWLDVLLSSFLKLSILRICEYMDCYICSILIELLLYTTLVMLILILHSVRRFLHVNSSISMSNMRDLIIGIYSCQLQTTRMKWFLSKILAKYL